MGNHDSKFNLSREQTLRSGEDLFALVYQPDGSIAAWDYELLYFAPLRALSKVIAVLWFFDSRGGGTYQKSSAIDSDDIPNWVADRTASWFQHSSAQLAAIYGPLPSIAFVHIPPHVYLTTQESGLDRARFPGVNDDVPLAIQGGGTDDAKFVDALLSRRPSA